ARLQMVLQVPADTGQRLDDADAVPLQQLAGTDARELQQLRRLDRSGGDDHFALRKSLPRAAFDRVRYTGCPHTLQQAAAGMGVGDYGQFGALHGRAQVRDGCAAAHAVARRALEIAESLLARAVEVVVAIDPELGARL